MQRSERAFEQAWRRVATGESPDQVAGNHVDLHELRDVLELADALRAVGRDPRLTEPNGWERLEARLAPRAPRIHEVAPRRRVRRRAVPILLAAALSVALLSGTALGAKPGTPLYPARRVIERVAVAVSPSSGTDLRVAYARLDDVLFALREGREALAPDLARDLMTARASAGQAGVDLTDLDGRIARDVPAALEGVSTQTQAVVRSILGSLLPPETAPSPPATTPSDGDGTRASGGPGTDPGPDGKDEAAHHAKPPSDRKDQGGDRDNHGGNGDGRPDGSGGDDEPSGGDDEPSGGDDEPSGGDDEPSGGDDEPSGGDDEEPRTPGDDSGGGDD